MSDEVGDLWLDNVEIGNGNGGSKMAAWFVALTSSAFVVDATTADGISKPRVAEVLHLLRDGSPCYCLSVSLKLPFARVRV